MAESLGMSAVLFAPPHDAEAAFIQHCATDLLPALRNISGVISTEVWVGGFIDRSVRGIAAGSPRVYLLLTETESSLIFRDRSFVPLEASRVASPISRNWQLEQIVPGNERSPPSADGLILVSMNVEPQHEKDFNAWYTTEHIPMLSRVPGMICARRFRALQGEPRYVALYHVADHALYRHASWLAANQTPWIKRIYPHQRDPIHIMFTARV